MDERLAFLRAVLPENSGLYCITTITRPNEEGKVFTNNMPFSDLETAFRYALDSARNVNVYFALSSFTTDGKFRRKADYAVAQKAFWIDLDCDAFKATEGKAYASKAEAMQALADFIREVGLPVPTVVDSGNGYHCYWIMTRAIRKDMWIQIAKLWRKCIRTHGLIVDHHRTCDAASVLRVPGTYNHKHDALEVKLLNSPKAVITPEDFLKKLLSLDKATEDIRPSAPAVPDLHTMGIATDGLSFGGGFTDVKDLPLREPQKMILGCRQIREMATSSYPAWMLAARTLLTMHNGRAWTHSLSKLDPAQYSVEATDRLCDNLESNKEFGAGLCETFESYCSGKCQDCPYKGKIKSPFSLAGLYAPKQIEMPKANIETADLSQGEISLSNSTEVGTYEPYRDANFQVIPGEGIYKNYIDKDGLPRQLKISDNEIYIHTLCVDYTQGSTPKRTYIMRRIVPGVAPVDIPFSIEDALGAQKIEMWTAQCGLLPPPQFKKDFYNFMNTYIAAIQNKLPEVYVRNHFGWVNCTDRTTGLSYPGFIVGQDMYAGGNKSQVRLDERAGAVATKLGTRGSLQEWLQVPDLYRKLDQKFAQLLMCTAFGAPLMKFGRGTATNVAYNFWDINGGKGKSSMLKAIASVWGDPQQMLMGRTDTHAARFQQYAVYRNLPILIDELTGISDEETASMLYDIVNGREKARSTATGTGLAQSGHWETITVFTANQSMYESLKSYRTQSSATCMRLIECECDFNDYSNNLEIVRIINNAMTAARDNYGIAGNCFMQYVTKNLDAVQQLVETFATRFAAKYAESSDERFWLYGIAIPLVAGRLAKLLGLINYDIDALEKYCVEELLPCLRRKVKTNKPTGSNLIMDFLGDSIGATLVVYTRNRNNFAKYRETHAKELQEMHFGVGFSNDPYVAQMPAHRLAVRRELETNMVYISTRALSKWCRDHGVSLDAMLQGLYKEKRMESTIGRKINLARSVPTLPQGQTMAYAIQLEDKYD